MATSSPGAHQPCRQVWVQLRHYESSWERRSESRWTSWELVSGGKYVSGPPLICQWTFPDSSLVTILDLCMALVFIKYSNLNSMLVVTLFFDVDVWTSNSNFQLGHPDLEGGTCRKTLPSSPLHTWQCSHLSAGVPRPDTHSESPLARKTVSAWTLGSSTILF